MSETNSPQSTPPQPARRPTSKPTTKLTGAQRAQAQSQAAKSGTRAPARPKGRSGSAKRSRSTPLPTSTTSSAGIYAWSAVGLVVVIIAVLIGVSLTTSNSTPSDGVHTEFAMPSAVVKAATTIPTAIYNKIGVIPTVSKAPTAPTVLPSNTPPVTANGKPLVLYVGGEFCPFCAAERWALVTSLSRFGRFSNLGAISSSATDVYPNTSTFDFYHSSYTSPYIDFQPVEIYGEAVDTATGGHVALQKLDPTQQALYTKYTGTSADIPFVLVSNKLYIVGASYNPSILASLTWNQIGNQLDNPASPVTQTILATSNYISAGICAATANQPSAVCKSSGVQAAVKALKVS